MTFSKFFIIAGLVALVGQAQAAPVAKRASLFGIEIGSPITLPKCQASSVGIVDSRSNDVMCVDYSSAADLQSGQVSVVFARGQVPLHIQFEHLDVKMRDGVVDSVKAFTDGMGAQPGVYADLTKRYGKPHSLRRVKEKNGMGASFVVIYATWKLPAGDTITLLGALSDFSTGTVYAMSAAATAQEAADIKASSGPAL